MQLHLQPAISACPVPFDAPLQLRLYTVLTLHFFQQHAMQIGAVYRGVGGTVTQPELGIKMQHAQHAAIECIAHTQHLRERCHLLQRIAQAPALEHTHHIRPQLDARTDLGPGIGLFNHAGRNLLACQRQCGSEPANAAACYQQRCIHMQIVNRNCAFLNTSSGIDMQ